jgi:P-type Ca2+ transporter type 2C
MKLFYQLNVDETLKELNTSFSGLNHSEIQDRQNQHGLNSLEETKQKSKLSILLNQLDDVMILILLVAAVISFAVGEHTDAYVILAIIIGNAWLGFTQEYHAEESMKMLKKMAAQFAMAFRENKPVKIDASELVPGDIITVVTGDIIPADARLIETSSLKVDEASLTGESHSVEKITEPIQGENLVPGDQLNMLFKGTIVSNGSAKGVVTATGMNTELGKIAGLMGEDLQKTPLQKRLATFSKQLAVAVILICLVVFGYGILRDEPPQQMFLIALSLAVAALPEALPAVVTIALARGASRMADQKALIRKLPAVETLGSVTYICSDKTGTLTRNEMNVEKLQAVSEKEDLLLYAMLLNNELKFSEEGLLGDSTEVALVKHALDEGKSKEEAESRFPFVTKLPFDSERMRMSTLHRDKNRWVLFAKGAPAKMAEIFEEKYKAQAEEWLDINRTWASEGLRVLFFGYKIFNEEPRANHEMENDLELLGIVALIDPPREEVIDAIKECKSAGINTVMITGDQALTAKAIAMRLEIMNDNSQAVLTGAELQKIPKEQFKADVKKIAVYARVSPEQKLNIIQALQENNEIVAMTGDGVNDAPSLKQADIGLAMGITGTDVSKEAADMILLDDNFTTIVKAVKEGRRIYENIKKFIVYVLSCNFSEILTIFFAPVLGFAIPLLPIHILWINLVTDGLPGIALVTEHSEKHLMQQPPRPPKENLFSGGLLFRIIATGVIMAIAALFIQWWSIQNGLQIRAQQTMVFTTLCFVQLGNALTVRSLYNSIFSTGIFSNKKLLGGIIVTVILQLSLIYIPFMQRTFKTAHLDLKAMGMIIAITLACVILIEVIKLIVKKKYGPEKRTQKI